MGKQISYEAAPTGPRAAKVAWSYFEARHGTPSRMFFDTKAQEWVAMYGGPSQAGTMVQRAAPEEMSTF